MTRSFSFSDRTDAGRQLARAVEPHIRNHHAVERLGQVADRVVALHTPTWFGAVGQWYKRFDQTRDEEVTRLLAEARSRPRSGPVRGTC